VPQISDFSIKSAKAPATGTITLWDSSLKGFGVRVSSGGAKTFVVLIASGRRQSIGRYPLISLSTARIEAKCILAEKTLGKVRLKHTAFDDARDTFLIECECRLRHLSVGLYRRHLSVHYPFGRKSVGDVSPSEIARNLNKLHNRPSEKEHAHRIGRTFFRSCVRQNLIERSPMEDMGEPPLGQARDRVLSEEELRAVYKTAREARNSFQRLVCLLIHTAGRRGEITALQWSYISTDTITLPADITKNKRTHRLPIGQSTKALLDSWPRADDSLYVFPSSREHVRGKPSTVMTGFSAAKREFDKACGVSDWTLHDLRRTFATGLQKLGVRLEVTEALLNHVSGSRSGIVGIYQRHNWEPEMRQAMRQWEEYLSLL
jgi:integrase